MTGSTSTPVTSSPPPPPPQPASPSPPAMPIPSQGTCSAACSDVPPSADYTCSQQVHLSLVHRSFGILQTQSFHNVSSTHEKLAYFHTGRPCLQRHPRSYGALLTYFVGIDTYMWHCPEQPSSQSQRQRSDRSSNCCQLCDMARCSVCSQNSVQGALKGQDGAEDMSSIASGGLASRMHCCLATSRILRQKLWSMPILLH